MFRNAGNNDNDNDNDNDNNNNNFIIVSKKCSWGEKPPLLMVDT